MRAYRRGKFTLIEMLVVIAIIGILASLLMPSLQGALDSAHSVSCSSNLRNMGMTAQAYSGEYGGLIPARLIYGGIENNWPLMIAQYSDIDYTAAWLGNSPRFKEINGTILTCPSFEFNPTYSPFSYGMNWRGMPDHSTWDQCSYLPLRVNRLASPSKTRYLCDTKATADNWNVSYIMDGTPLDSWATIYMRHSGKTMLNMLMVDSHIEPLNLATYSQTVFY